MTLAEVIADKAKTAELISLSGKRMTASSSYYRSKFDTFIRCFKIYRAIQDAVDDSDEPNSGPNYAFGIVEDAVAALSESILNSRVPTPARARRAGDQMKAENFNAVAGAYFASGQYQTDYPNSVRERVIGGSNWEFDSWAWKYAKGKKWVKTPRIDPETGVPFVATEEVDFEHPIQVGYHTRFVPFLNVRPQPRVTSVEKMKWLLEIEENVALEDLEQMMYVDPATGQKVPFFYLDEIRQLKAGGATIRPEIVDRGGADQNAEYRNLVDGVAQPGSEDNNDTTDQLNLVWTHEPNRIYCVANNKFLIAYVEDLYQRPGIKARIKRCTPQPNSLMGIGLIEPVEDLLYELDDIHVLSMRNWIRIINKMIAYDPDAVPFADNDFTPRAGGKIRVRPQLGGSVGSSIVPIDQTDVTPSMLAQESNNKGLIQKALGTADFAKGIEGTQQYHDTLGGLEKISQAVAKRVASIRRQELAGFQKQMYAMEGMYSQFLVDKTSFMFYGPDGSTVNLEFDLWDLETGGRGFDFIIDYDPAFGDDALMRNQMMQYLQQGIAYNGAVMQQFPPGSKPLCGLDEIFRRLSRNFGFSDTSKILARPDGVLAPSAEFQLMLQGKPVMVNPMEDMISHYADHIRQYQDPSLAEAEAKGAVPPDTRLRLQSHIQATAAAIQAVMRDPSGLVRAKQHAQTGGPPPDGAQGPAPMMPGTNVQEGVSHIGQRTLGGRENGGKLVS